MQIRAEFTRKRWKQSVEIKVLVFSVSCPASAEVTVNMEDRVEVLRGQMALITCNFVSAEGIGGMTIEWFYVSGA